MKMIRHVKPCVLPFTGMYQSAVCEKQELCVESVPSSSLPLIMLTHLVFRIYINLREVFSTYRYAWSFGQLYALFLFIYVIFFH